MLLGELVQLASRAVIVFSARIGMIQKHKITYMLMVASPNASIVHKYHVHI